MYYLDFSDKKRNKRPSQNKISQFNVILLKIRRYKTVITLSRIWPKVYYLLKFQNYERL